MNNEYLDKVNNINDTQELRKYYEHLTSVHHDTLRTLFRAEADYIKTKSRESEIQKNHNSTVRYMIEDAMEEAVLKISRLQYDKQPSLVQQAKYFDAVGLYKEADVIDNFLRKYAQGQMQIGPSQEYLDAESSTTDDRADYITNHPGLTGFNKSSGGLEAPVGWEWSPQDFLQPIHNQMTPQAAASLQQAVLPGADKRFYDALQRYNIRPMQSPPKIKPTAPVTTPGLIKSITPAVNKAPQALPATTPTPSVGPSTTAPNASPMGDIVTQDILNQAFQAHIKARNPNVQGSPGWNVINAYIAKSWPNQKDPAQANAAKALRQKFWYEINNGYIAQDVKPGSLK